METRKLGVPVSKINIGDRFNKFVVLEDLPFFVGDERFALCRCDCGKEMKVRVAVLKKGIKSCGCGRTESIVAMFTTHGMTHTKEHDAWMGIKRRCFNTKEKNYKDYGARGITMHPEWVDNFEAFYAEIGPAPTPEHTVDRIKNNLGYIPGNLRWATMKEQCNNRRNSRYVEYKGETKTVAEWADIIGINQGTLRHRLFRENLNPEEAFTRKNRYTNKRK